MTHLDTIPRSPGADDDASGVALLLELARWVRNYRIPVGVHFLFLGAEEKVPDYDKGRFFSSEQYIDYQMKIGLDFLDGVIMVDKVGVGKHFQVLQIDSTKTDLTNKLVQFAKTLNLPLECKVINRFQKSMPFEDAGLPTAWLEWSPDPNLDTSKDTPDEISKENIEKTFRLLSDYLLTGGT